MQRAKQPERMTSLRLFCLPANKETSRHARLRILTGEV